MKTIGTFDDKFVMFAKKLGQHSDQIENLIDTTISDEKKVEALEEELAHNKLSFENMFLIPGIIGPDEK